MNVEIRRCRPCAYDYAAIPLNEENLSDVAREYFGVGLTPNRDALIVSAKEGRVKAEPGMVLVEHPHGEYEVLNDWEYQLMYEEEEVSR